MTCQRSFGREQALADQFAILLKTLCRHRNGDRDEIAEQVAARRESVTRALKKLEARGMLVLRRGRIEIRKLDAKAR